MKKNSNHISDDILVKYLLGETSELEAAQVNQWINLDENNEKYFNQFKLIWEESKKTTLPSALNEDEAWERFKQRTKQNSSKTKYILLSWYRIAAALLLLLGLSYIILLWSDKKTTPLQASLPHPTDTAAHMAKEFVCNSTSCPLEICIVQAFKCGDIRSSDVTTCSTIAPDESGQLSYKAFSSIGKNCVSIVKEIRIKRVTTGETIILDEHSDPVTAQNLFSYITGQIKGDIVAGIFHTDCNNQAREHGLRLDNKFGDLILQ